MEREKLISLVTAAQKGDMNAMNELFASFYQGVYYFALKLVEDEGVACDVTQEVFLEIINTLDSLQEPAAFVKWMKTVTYHQCTRYFRKKRDVLVDEDEDGNTIFDALTEDTAEFIPDKALDQEDLKQTVMAMVDSLSEEQRAAVMMFYFDEFSVKQIAEIQEVSENTVKSRLNYARKGIRKAVEDYEKKTGVKLHCLGVLPILLWLFKGYFGQAVPTASAAAIAEGISAAAGISVSASAASVGAVAATASGAAAAGIGAKLAALPLVTKIVAGIVAAALAISGGVAVGALLGDDSDDPSDGISTEGNMDMNGWGGPSDDEIIPQGMIYTLHDGTVLKGGDLFPEECTAGDTVLYGDYCYGYECVYTKNLTEWGHTEDWMLCKDIPTPSDSGVTKEDITACWLPMVADRSKESYGPLVSEINGRPIGVLWMTFYGCKSMTVAPEIPEGVTSVSVAFYDCSSLKTAPVIPASVKRLMGTFQNCTSLSGDVEIRANLDKSTFWNYESTFANTKNPINLVGTTPEADLILIADEPTNRRITVNGKTISFEDAPQYYDLSRVEDTTPLTVTDLGALALENAEHVGGESYGDPIMAIYAVDYAASCFEDMDIFGYGVTVDEMCGLNWGNVGFYSYLLGQNAAVQLNNADFTLNLPFERKEDLFTAAQRDVEKFAAFLNGAGDPYVSVGGTYRKGLENVTEDMLKNAADATGTTRLEVFTSERFTVGEHEFGLSLSISSREEEGIFYYCLGMSINFFYK